MTQGSATQRHGGWLQRGIETAAIGAFLVLSYLTCDTLLGMRGDVSWPLGLWLLAMLLGLLFADFIAGVVHWAADNYGSAEWPLLGPGFIGPFREHHVDPRALCKHGFIELNGNNCLVSLLTFWWASLAEGSAEWVYFWRSYWLWVAWWTLGTNNFHAWSHAEKPNRLVAWLQRHFLILPPGHHDVHHRAPHDRNYCITTGWMNPVLRTLRFFEVVEWLIAKTFGVRPLHVATRAAAESALAAVPEAPAPSAPPA